MSDLLISEGTFSVDPDAIEMDVNIDRGELITESSKDNDYKRYLNTESGISPRALPGLEGYVHVVATDEHDEDSVLLSDEFTNPHKRRKMVEKRARKFNTVAAQVGPPTLQGPEDAEVTLIGFGSTYGAITEAIEQLASEGVNANHLHVKWLVPFPSQYVVSVVSRAKIPIVIENNYSGQFYRYLRSETGLTIDNHIRKYDGEPFMPHHIVDGVRESIAGNTQQYVPYQEVMVVNEVHDYVRSHHSGFNQQQHSCCAHVQGFQRPR